MSISLLNSNLHLEGASRDVNGNRTVKLSFPNARSFSIQTLGNLPKTHDILKGLKASDLKKISAKDLAAIEKEAISYIKKYGSDTQKKKLKTY